jgi:hypothetical protein
MPTTPEAIAADIAEAATAGFRGRLIARGQARAIIWRDGALPPGAPAFAPQLSYDLHSYGYALLGLGLRLRELGGDAAQARTAFEQAATALEAVIAKGNRQEVDRDFHFIMAAASYHLAHLSARAYSLLAIVEADENFAPPERVLALLMRACSTIGYPAKAAMPESPPTSRPTRSGRGCSRAGRWQQRVPLRRPRYGADRRLHGGHVPVPSCA